MRRLLRAWVMALGTWLLLWLDGKVADVVDQVRLTR